MTAVRYHQHAPRLPHGPSRSAALALTQNAARLNRKTFCGNIVMDSWIDGYIGEWKDAAGNCLSIRKITDETARVTFLAAPGKAPIVVPIVIGLNKSLQGAHGARALLRCALYPQ